MLAYAWLWLCAVIAGIYYLNTLGIEGITSAWDYCDSNKAVVSDLRTVFALLQVQKMCSQQLEVTGSEVFKPFFNKRDWLMCSAFCFGSSKIQNKSLFHGQHNSKYWNWQSQHPYSLCGPDLLQKATTETTQGYPTWQKQHRILHKKILETHFQLRLLQIIPHSNLNAEDISLMFNFPTISSYKESTTALEILSIPCRQVHKPTEILLPQTGN